MFNTWLAKARIKPEHCNGLLKARFPYFKGVRINIQTTTDLTRIICIFLCATVLHNLLIHEPIPEEWEKEVASLTTAMNDDDNNNNLVIPENARINERRNRVYQYMIEKYNTEDYEDNEKESLLPKLS